MQTAGYTSGPCPTRADLSAYLRGDLPPADAVAVDSHLSECPGCALLLGELATPGGGGSTPSDCTPGRTPAAAPAEPGTRAVKLGQYRLHERIGRGGMGSVFRAWHGRLKRWVAIKVLPAGRAGDPDWVARFDREMEVVGRLDHPHIVRATDAGEDGGVHYLVMDLIDGADLGRVVRVCGRLPVADACELVRQAALGLQHAHEHGLVHRDVKPHNLMLAAGGVKVLDLGLALFRPADRSGLTHAGQVMGTPDYMAPEQWDDFRSVDARADLYALGCTLYHLLAGRPYAARRGTPAALPSLAGVRADVPPALDALIARLTAADPTDRPASAAVAARELAAFAAGADLPALLARVPQEAPDDLPTAGWENQAALPTATPSRSPVPRHRAWVWAGGGVVTAAVAVAAVVYGRGGLGGDPGGATGTGPEPTPAPTPLPAPLPAIDPPPRPPAKGEWVSLLRTPPTTRVWKGDFGTRLDHDPRAEAISVQTFSRALIPLGRTDARGFRYQVAVRQIIWTGGVGVYFGGRVADDGVFRFQVLDLRPRPQGGPGWFSVARGTGDVRLTGGEPTVNCRWFAGTNLTRPPGNAEQLIEIGVDARGLVVCRWDGDPCAELVAPEANARLRPDDYQGEFGIFVSGGSTFVSGARFMPTH